MVVMKKAGLFLIVIFLIAPVTSFQLLNGQEKSKEDLEKELRIQQTIEQQKKAMSEQKRAQEEALQKLQESQDVLDKTMRDINVEIEMDSDPDSLDDDFQHMKIRRRMDRSFRFDEPVIIGPDINEFYMHSFGNDNESTSWEFSKTVKEKSISNDYTFDVEKTANSVIMSVMGDCKAGDIRIKIVMPSGKTYSDIVIDEFGNLNWRKSFNISETENQDKAGAWKFKITSTKATGYFKISLKAY
jgi:hypothetical protein